MTDTATIVSVNTGLPREVTSHGKAVLTGIFKTPVKGRVAMRRLNLDGDRQADLSVHGGEYKAVYCYPVEHYDWWRKELKQELDPAMFGENLTTRGLSEHDVRIGDQFAIGTASVVVTQPRLPCYKLGIRFGSDLMVKRFQASGRSGFYVAVTREGEVGAGDTITRTSRDPNGVAISDFVRLYTAKAYGEIDLDLLQRALQLPTLPESWKEHIRAKLEEIT